MQTLELSPFRQWWELNGILLVCALITLGGVVLIATKIYLNVTSGEPHNGSWY